MLKTTNLLYNLTVNNTTILSMPPLGLWSYLAALSGSQDLCVDSPGPDAGSPAGRAAACALLASDLRVVGTTLPGSG